MASDIRECDICGTVFRILEVGYRAYNQIELPSLSKLQTTVEHALNSNIREYVSSYDYDVCTSCLIAICKAMLAQGELRK